MGKDITPDQALDLLTLEGCLDCQSLDDHVVGEDETNEVLMARDVG